MNPSLMLDRSVQSLALPPEVPAHAVLGQRGKIIKQIRDITGARLTYNTEDHRVDIGGRPRSVQAAARLVEKTVEHYQYSGLHLAPKEVLNILPPDLSPSASSSPASPPSLLQLIPSSRPVVCVAASFNGFVMDLAPADTPLAAAAAAPPPPPPATGRALPLVLPASRREEALQRLLDVAVTIALQHPAEFGKLEVRMYLGKLVLCELRSSVRTLPVEALLTWTFPAARAIFDTSVPQDSVRSLDSYLTSLGLAPTKQSKSASLHLETTIPWIQYHPTFTVRPDGSLALAKLETLGCKPLTVVLAAPADRLDLRLRCVGATEHTAEDPVAAQLRRLAEEGQFALVNGSQVTIPGDLQSLDLTLTSARVKLKRVYATSAPIRPPSAAAAAARAAAAAAATAEPAPAKRGRGKRPAATDTAPAPAVAPSSAAAAEGALPAVSLKVSVAAVVDNLGGRRLEVTAACPELNDALLEVNRRREAPAEVRAGLEAQLRSVLELMEGIQRNVAFEP